MRKIDSLAWNSGYSAFYDHKSKDDNPYMEGSIAADDWDAGFDCAESDSNLGIIYG